MSKKPQEISIQRTSTLNGINAFGNFLKKIGLDPFTLSAEKVIAKAKKKAGFSGHIPESTIQGLTILIDSINSESRANPFGNLAIKGLSLIHI